MKRTIAVILAVVGAGGLIALLSSQPGSTKTGAGSQSTDSAAAQNTPATTPGAPPVPYKDGTYTGSAADNAYGTVQVQAVVSGGKITQVNFLQMPSDQEHSQEVTAQAEPILQSEAISAQSAQIDTVSGATQDTEAFTQSLQSALSQAQA